MCKERWGKERAIGEATGGRGRSWI